MTPAVSPDCAAHLARLASLHAIVGDDEPVARAAALSAAFGRGAGRAT